MQKLYHYRIGYTLCGTSQQMERHIVRFSKIETMEDIESIENELKKNLKDPNQRCLVSTYKLQSTEEVEVCDETCIETPS